MSISVFSGEYLMALSIKLRHTCLKPSRSTFNLMLDKPIYWIGTSKEDIAKFPSDAKKKAGFQLRAVQKGDSPTDFKPMSIVGKGVEEIRIKTGEAYRIFYVARFPEAVYVLHAFNKKVQKTSKKDIVIGKQRYQTMIEFRKQLKDN